MSQDDIREGLSDHENRLSELEASLYYPDGLTPQVRLDKLEKIISEILNASPWVTPQWDRLQQTEAKLLFLEKRLNEHLDIGKKKYRKSTYKGIET